MHRFDQVVIDPSRQELDRLLTQATSAANKGCRARLLKWAITNTDAFLRERKKASEGFRQWTAEAPPKTSGRETRSALAVVWWTDPMGRIHHRIAGDRVYSTFKHLENLLCPYVQRPPLWLVYPEDLYFRAKGEPGDLFAACRCGAIGSPESLGWMGPYCALCHDRVEEGTALEIGGPPMGRMLASPERLVAHTAFSADGGNLVYHDWSRVCSWNLATGQVRVLYQDDQQVMALAVSPDNQTVAVGDRNGQVQLLSPIDGQVRKTLTPGEHILALAFSPNSSLLAVVPYTRVELWDVGAGCLHREVASGVVAYPELPRLGYSPDGKTLAVEVARELLLWNDDELRTLAIPGVKNPSRPAFSRDGRLLGVIDDFGCEHVCLWDVQENRVRTMLKANYPRDFAFSPDGQHVAVAEGVGDLRVYSVEGGPPLATYAWHTSIINTVAFSPDGRWIATAGNDGFIKLWPIDLFLQT